MSVNDIELFQKFRQHIPDNKNENDLLELIYKTNGNEEFIDREVVKWWEDYRYLSSSQSPRSLSLAQNYNSINGNGRLSSSNSVRFDKQQSISSLMSPKTRFADISSESIIASEVPPQYHSYEYTSLSLSADENYRNVNETNKQVNRSKSGMDEGLQKSRTSSNYLHPEENTEQDKILFAEKNTKNTGHAKIYVVNNVDPSEIIVDASNTEEVNGTRSERSRHDKTRREHGREKSQGRREDRSSKPRRERSRSRRSTSRVRTKSRPAGSRFSSQVRLLAEHCFTLSDDAIASLVKYRIPQQSRWDYKEKVQKRDDLIKHLQEALFVLSQEKQRFQSACFDIEKCLHDENRELRHDLNDVAKGGSDPKEVQELKEQIAATLAKIKAKNEEAMKLAQTKREREKKIHELSNEIIRLQSDQKEDTEIKAQIENRVYQLKTEIEKNKIKLEEQNQELSSALERFGDTQKGSEDREVTLENARAIAEEQIQELEDEKRNLQEQLNSQAADVAFLFSELATLKESLHNAQEELKLKEEMEEESRYRAQQLRDALIVERELRARAEVREEEERKERIVACAQLIAMEATQHDNMQQIENDQLGDITEWKETFDQLTQEKEDLSEANTRIRGKVADMQGQVSALKNELEKVRDRTDQKNEVDRLALTLKKHLSELDQFKNDRKQNLQIYDTDIEHLEKLIQEKELKLQLGEIERKKILNTIQELRGNIRVFARVRPFLPGEGDENEVDANGNPLNSYSSALSTIEVKPDGNSIYIRKRDDYMGDVLQEEAFTFDQCFAPSIGQEAVFKHVSEFIQYAVDGYNVCVFGYGQSGSGKTHTLQGSGTGPMRGIIPRALDMIMEYKSGFEEQGWEYKIEISFIQIENEIIKDLINEENELDLNVRMDKKGRTYIDGLTKMEFYPTENQQMDKIMEIIARYRNSPSKNSAVSNSLFTVYITGTNARQGYITEGQLNLCDLGSCDFQDENENSEMSETKKMNKSLVALTDTFSAIADRHSNINYKTSKLTYLLMPILSGEGKILMIINLSPAQSNFSTSLATFRFGRNVNQCELGKAVKNVRDLDGNDKTKERSNTQDKSPLPPTAAKQQQQQQPSKSGAKSSSVARRK